MLVLLPTLRWHHHLCCAGIFGASLLLLQWRPHCSCCAGVVSVVALALSPSLLWRHCPCCSSVVAIVVIVLLPLSCRPLCNCCAGVVTIVAMAPSTLLHLHCCRCCNGAFAVVALRCHPNCTGVAVVVMVLLTLLCWHLYHNCTGIAAVVVLVSLSSLRWHLPPCRNDIVTLVALTSLPSLCWCCCWRWDGAINVVALASLQLLRKHHCCCCNSVVAVVARCCHPSCARIFAIVVLALLLSLQWHCQMTPSLVERYCSLPIICDNLQWWMIQIFDVFGAHHNNLSSMKKCADAKILSIKDKGDSSSCNQAYDKHVDVAKSNKHHIQCLLTLLRSMKNRHSNLVDQSDLIHCGFASIWYSGCNPGV